MRGRREKDKRARKWGAPIHLQRPSHTNTNAYLSQRVSSWRIQARARNSLNTEALAAVKGLAAVGGYCTTTRTAASVAHCAAAAVSKKLCAKLTLPIRVAWSVSIAASCCFGGCGNEQTGGCRYGDDRGKREK